MIYSALVAAIKAYTENYEDDFVANIPLFVRQTEQRVFNTVLFPALRKSATSACEIDNKFLSCPGDFLGVSALAVIDLTGSYEFLLNKDANFIRQCYPTPTSTGLPQYYALYGPRSDAENELTFLLGPTPDQEYEVELHYFYYPESITTSASGTSWLGDNFDSVLLYGSLVEAYTFMKGEADMLELYNAKFTEALAMAKRLGEGLERGDTYRAGEPRQPT